MALAASGLARSPSGGRERRPIPLVCIVSGAVSRWSERGQRKSLCLSRSRNKTRLVRCARARRIGSKKAPRGMTSGQENERGVTNSNNNNGSKRKRCPRPNCLTKDATRPRSSARSCERVATPVEANEAYARRPRRSLVLTRRQASVSVGPDHAPSSSECCSNLQRARPSDARCTHW